MQPNIEHPTFINFWSRLNIMTYTKTKRLGPLYGEGEKVAFARFGLFSYDFGRVTRRRRVFVVFVNRLCTRCL